MIALITQIVLVVAGVMLGAAAFIGVSRIAIGPSNLDRTIAADLMVAVVIASLAMLAIVTGSSANLLILLLLSLLGFTAAVSMARLVSDRVISRRRLRERKEAEEQS